MLATLAISLTALDVNEKAIQVLMSAGRHVAREVGARYQNDPDFASITAKIDDASGFTRKAQYAWAKPSADAGWKYASASDRLAWKTSLLNLLTPLFKGYELEPTTLIGSDGKEAGAGDSKVWREKVRINEKLDGYYEPFNFVSLMLDYQTGEIVTGLACFAYTPIRMASKITDALIQKTVSKDGKPDKVEIRKQWFPYNVVYASKGSEEHKLHIVLATFVTATQGKKETVYLFDQSGGVQANPTFKAWKPKDPVPPKP